MKILLVGGTGLISTGVAEIAIERGIDVTLLNRGRRPSYLAQNARVIHADFHDENATAAALKGEHFDCVIDFIAMKPEDIERAARIWSGITDQYIFISSASGYSKPLRNIVVTEDAPFGDNPYWEYSRNKAAAEETLKRLVAAGFPGTVVRPSLTYGDISVPFTFFSRNSRWAIPDRILKGKPIVVQGDGQSLWVITHNTDFARGILGLCGNPAAVGEAFHITNDERLTWDMIYRTFGEALGVEPKLCHIASDRIVRFRPDLAGITLGDHSCSVIFDNTKIRRFVPDFKCRVPLAEGARHFVDFYNRHPELKIYDGEWNRQIDFLIENA